MYFLLIYFHPQTFFFKILLSKPCGMLLGTFTIKSLFSVHILSIATIKQPLTPVVLLSLQCVTMLSLNPLYSLYYFMTRNEGERQSFVQQTTVGICHGRNLQSEIHSFLSTVKSLKSHSYSLRSEVICAGSLKLKVRHCSESYIITLLQYWTGLPSGLAL